MPFLMLGEALVDPICEQAAGIDDAAAFTPHSGGAGRDPWGRWLLDRLREEGVDTRWFSLDQRRRTPIAVATVAAGGEPTFAIYARAAEWWGAVA